MTFTVLLVFFFLKFSFLNGNVINIDNGPISGEEYANYYAYRGIPYAMSPVGELRLAPPKPYLQTWNETREFKNYGSPCSAYTHIGYIYEGNEDCLFINVFVPKLVADSQEKVPVIFAMHGGVFMFGSGQSYQPENIMSTQNMILVSINYRLGILGFLSTEDEVIPGNFGLKDQVEALKWVQKNIHAFNGDPNRVMIMGNSAGGASVHLHYMSQLSNGLFNNGFAISGTALNPYIITRNAKEKAHQVAGFLNCSQEPTTILECLRGKPAEELVLLAKHFQPFLYNPVTPFGPVVEPSSDSAFLSEDPIVLLREGRVKDFPLFLSMVQDEGLYPSAEFYSNQYLSTIDENWTEYAPFILVFNDSTTNAEKKLQTSLDIKRHYMGIQPITERNFGAFNDIISDRLFKYGGNVGVKYQSLLSPSYFYYFRWKTAAEYFWFTNDNIGVDHGSDVFLVFNTGRENTDEERVVIKQFVDMYYNFAASNTAIYGNLTVERIGPDDFKALEINSPTDYRIIQLNDEFGQVQFWNDIETSLTSVATRNNNFIIVSILLSLAMILFAI